MVTVRTIFWILLFSPTFGYSGEVPPEGPDLDKAKMEEVEDLSESLANALLEFSVAARDRDFARMFEFFAPSVKATLWPAGSGHGEAVTDWIDSAHTNLDASAMTTVDNSQFLENWKSLLAEYSETEDVRFKVKDATFADRSTDGAKFKFFIVGRDQSHQRRWQKGNGHMEASLDSKGQWKISLWVIDDIDTYTASEDLFSEVGYPAGVAETLPPYGSPGNDNFLYHGSAAGDLDADGFVDLVVTGNQRCFIYLNQKDGTFRDAGLNIGLPPMPQATAPLMIDYDNDGDLDLFFSASGQQMLFENQLKPRGELLFLDLSIESGIAKEAIGFSAAAGDINNDGWPDIYVASYNQYGKFLPNSWHQATNGTPNLLFVNQKDGTFKELSSAYGVRDTRWSYAAQFADVDGDGKQDLYVANDYGENALYLNRGDHFVDNAVDSGVLDPGNGMGVSFGDINNDGILDLFVTNMSSTAGNRILNRLFPSSNPSDSVLRKLAAGSTMFQGLGGGKFTDVTGTHGPFSTGWAWGGVFVDFDNDGWQDVYCNSGFVSGKSMKDT
ncbi:MAG: VCBS repeat-containing protein [Acidobacteriota bacterium]|nr:MAG: VCBS repeat-containing protein [Acidobacteriota bacterium]